MDKSSEAPFMLQSQNGRPVCCPDCKTDKPLMYPGVLVPMGPPTKQYLDEEQKLIKWTFDYNYFCIKHAIKRLKRMKERDITP